MSVIHIVYIFIILIISGCNTATSNIKPFYAAQPLERLAVVALPHKHMPAAQVENIAIEALSDRGYLISSRSDFRRILDEQRIQVNQLTERKAARVGRVLNVDAIFIFELTNYNIARTSNGSKYLKNASVVGRVIGVERADVLWIENVKRHQPGLVGLLATLPSALLIGGSNTNPVTGMTQEILKRFPYPSR